MSSLIFLESNILQYLTDMIYHGQFNFKRNNLFELIKN